MLHVLVEHYCQLVVQQVCLLPALVNKLLHDIRHIEGFAALHWRILSQRLEVRSHQSSHGLHQPGDLLHQVAIGVLTEIAFVWVHSDVEDQRHGTWKDGAPSHSSFTVNH